MATKKNFKRKTSRRQKYTEAEKMAYNLGLIERGKKNPDSRIFDSYQAGLNGHVAKQRKPLA